MTEVAELLQKCQKLVFVTLSATLHLCERNTTFLIYLRQEELLEILEVYHSKRSKPECDFSREFFFLQKILKSRRKPAV